MKRTLSCLAITALILPQTAHALPFGCYHRAYSQHDLAIAPNQGVAELWLWFEESYGEHAVTLRARMADQAQGARDGVMGMVLEQSAICRAEQDQLIVREGELVSASKFTVDQL